MKIYYRISDKSYEKPKLVGATKESCFNNFCQAFVGNDISIIADRCNQETLEMLRISGLPLTVMEKGNAGSLRTTIELAIAENLDDELIYFSEDDYLHLEKSPRLLQEGIKRADYVTLYDHPDKYTRFYDGGEISKVIKTDSSHWRYTASTCMTFGVKVKTLKEDIAVWKEFTEGDHPYDHFIFKKLCEEKRRRLAVCIPGAACHTDLTFSTKVHQLLIESWAIEMMIAQRKKDIEKNNLDPYEAYGGLEGYSKFFSKFLGMTDLEKLLALDVLFNKSSIDKNKKF